MSLAKEALRRPYDFIRNASNGADERTPFLQRPISIGGMVLLALAVVGFISMIPELKRYLRIRRM